jgi:hypothetical protein
LRSNPFAPASVISGLVAASIGFIAISVLLPRSSSAEISSGSLWTTRGEWQWRLWSVSKRGDVAFSDARTFKH